MNPEQLTTDVRPDAPWDRHAIQAEIKRRFGSQKQLARRICVTPAEVSLALGSPYPKAERAIADALGVPVQTLWPDRYWPDGRPRTVSTRPRTGSASQNMDVSIDTECRE